MSHSTEELFAGVSQLSALPILKSVGFMERLPPIDIACSIDALCCSAFFRLVEEDLSVMRLRHRTAYLSKYDTGKLAERLDNTAPGRRRRPALLWARLDPDHQPCQLREVRRSTGLGPGQPSRIARTGLGSVPVSHW